MPKRDLFHCNVPEDSVFERRLMAGNYTNHLWQILDLIEKGHLDLNPWYQRGAVWTLEQKQALIDTIVSGLTLPSFYFRELPTGTMPFLEVLDGKQRLLAIQEFAADGFPFRGKLHSEWSQDDQQRLKYGYFGVIHVQYTTDDEIVKLYNRINFNGTPHQAHQVADASKITNPITSWPQENIK